jgi:hypothetical protein
MAEIYFDFSQALLASERPTDLAPAELQDYELVLEEESFPFEERAIAVHEKNLELLGTGLYNAWIEKSLGRLAILMPGRYAKFEASSGFLTSIDHYAYRAPNAPTPGADDELEVPQQVEIVEASSAPREVGIETEAADAPASLADDAGSEEPAQPEPDLASESPVDEAPERSPGMEVDDASRD